MANRAIPLPHLPDEDSDSDGGVRLYDPKYQIPRPKQTLTTFCFTFDVPTPITTALVTTTILCAQSNARTPHLHEMSAIYLSISTFNSFKAHPPRRYMALNQVGNEIGLLQSHSLPPEVEDVTELLDQATISDSDPSKFPPRQLRRFLHEIWTQNNPYLARECREREKRNPFPGINMNSGWNRARYKLETAFEYPVGGIEECVKLQEGFAQFSLFRQLDALVLTEVDCGGFDHVFAGAGRDKSGWSREPGSWWGARKRVFPAGRGDLVQDIKATVKRIKRGINLWWEKAIEMEVEGKNLKRSYSVFTDKDAKVYDLVEDGTKVKISIKRIKTGSRQSEEVMSEAWRAKRRLQEKKAGRWTDGTLRMNRLWDAFYWADPKDMAWA